MYLRTDDDATKSGASNSRVSRRISNHPRLRGPAQMSNFMSHRNIGWLLPRGHLISLAMNAID